MPLLTFILVAAAVVAVGLVAFYKIDAINRLFKDAETLFLPALQGLASVLVGALTYFDWGPLLGLVRSAGASKEQVMGVAVVGVLQAVGLYAARVNRDPNLNRSQR